MAPTFDEDDSRDRLLSLWDAGQNLTAAATNRSDLEAALAAAQREYEAALARRSALLGALAAVQSAYAVAHVNAIAVGWSTTELSDAGLPTPPARHSGPRGTQRRAAAGTSIAAPSTAAPSTAAPSTAAPSTAAALPMETSPTPPSPSGTDATDPTAPVEGAHERSSWDTEQTAFLVTSRSKDNPVWYESMRQSPISPRGDEPDRDARLP
ncbi:hypothetical protein [Pengzhenrongella frigida]|uniref:Uncharacterized protein n=1 Tax=Pengzhenrongella frigida TaxID=1259133 RepID=A0A4Q5N4M1_9MICO|nr:hypothetical protein [Cellulomonas sp. HLT2-17]RYV51667.1 hypothetical protein EUA98_07130 [Cellulomonas sp. HLT2-17]